MAIDTGKGGPDGYYTVRDLSQILQMPESTIRKLLVEQRMCPFVRIGRSIRIEKSDFDTWLRDRKRDSRCAPSALAARLG